MIEVVGNPEIFERLSNYILPILDNNKQIANLSLGLRASPC